MENVLSKKFFDKRPDRNGGGRQLGQEDALRQPLADGQVLQNH